MKKIFFLLSLILILSTELYAARNFTVINTAGSPINFYMRDAVSMTLRVTNTNTAPDLNDGIREVRFTFPLGMLINSTGNVAPTGWNITNIDALNNRITFSASSPIYYFTAGNYMDFVISLNAQASNADAYENLTEVRVRYASGRKVTKNNLTNVAWYRRGLKIISMLANPELLVSGSSFTLTITVQNVSSAIQTNITATPNPPTEVSTGGFDPTPTNNPTIASLAVLQTSPLVYNYQTQATDEGTVYFTCNVKNRNGTTTGITAISNTLYIGRFTASISYSPECPLSGEVINVTMTVTNNNVFSLSNVIPTLTTYGTASLVRLSGPNPTSIATLVSGGTATFTYTYQITGAFDSSFYFSGYAVGQKTTPPVGIRQTPTYITPTRYVREYTLELTPDSVLSGTSNYYLKFTLNNRMNNLCPSDNNYNIRRVIITIPSGFGYSLDKSSYMIGNNISDINDPNYEYYTDNWTITSNINQIIFSSNSSVYDLPIKKDGYFSLYILNSPLVNSDSLYTFQTNIENVKGIVVNYTGSNVQMKVTSTPTGITIKPIPTKGGIREKHD